MPPPNDASKDPRALGALLGWKRYPSPHGVILRLQISTSLDLARAGRYDQYDVSLSSLQMRALGEFLIRSADARDGRIPPARPRRWWRW